MQLREVLFQIRIVWSSEQDIYQSHHYNSTGVIDEERTIQGISWWNWTVRT